MQKSKKASICCMLCDVWGLRYRQMQCCCAENTRLKAQVEELSAQLKLSKRLLGLLETGDPDAEGEVSRLLDGGDHDALGHVEDLATCDLGEGVDKLTAHAQRAPVGDCVGEKFHEVAS